MEKKDEVRKVLESYEKWCDELQGKVDANEVLPPDDNIVEIYLSG